MHDRLATDAAKAMVAGAAATAAASALMVLWHAAAAPPDLDVIALLAQWLGGGAALGWIAHGVIGVVLWPLAFAAAERGLPGNPSVRGLLFGVGAWLVMMLVLMPWTGGGVFAARLAEPFRMVLGSLALHLVYGWVLGFIYGRLTAPTHAEEAHGRGYSVR